MKKIILLPILAMLAGRADANECRGLITSNNACIGSESNFNSWDNHEPFDTDERIDEHRTYDVKRQKTTRPAARAPAAVPPIATPAQPAPPVSGDCAPCANAAPSAPSAQQDATTTDTKTQTSTQTTPTTATTTTTTTTTTKTTTTKQR
jgi:hypothetical protein